MSLLCFLWDGGGGHDICLLMNTVILKYEILTLCSKYRHDSTLCLLICCTKSCWRKTQREEWYEKAIKVQCASSGLLWFKNMKLQRWPRSKWAVVAGIIFCSMMETSFLFLHYKEPIVPSLSSEEYLMFRLHCSDPRMRPISSLDTVLPIYASLTPCYNRRSSHLVYRKPSFFSVELTYKGKARNNISLYPAQVRSWTNCRKDHRAHAGSLIVQLWYSEKSDCDITSGFKEKPRGVTGPCKRGPYKSPRPTASANTHRDMSECEANTVHTRWVLECEH